MLTKIKQLKVRTVFSIICATTFYVTTPKMTVEEFLDKRERKWHLRPELALTTESEIFRFIQNVGVASLSPEKKCLFPSLAQAIQGSSHRGHAQCYKNRPYAELIERFQSRYVESRRAFIVNLLSNTQAVASREWMVSLLTAHGEIT
jgi:hypothetical protein